VLSSFFILFVSSYDDFIRRQPTTLSKFVATGGKQTMVSSDVERTIRQFISEVSDQHHAMTGAVIAISAVQAAALGETCMQVSLDNQVDRLNWQDVTSRIEQMARLRDNLFGWYEQGTKAITERIALRESDVQLSSQRFWCEGSAEIGRLSIEAATLLQDFRPLVFENVRDDLEITINLLASTARAATLLLDSNLRIWSNAGLLEEYEPVRAELESQIDQLTPAARLRNE
jgi:formiminotetrahydrofolate cyclodeaminase